MHVSQIYNTNCTQTETPSPNQSTVKGTLIIKFNTYQNNNDTINTNIVQNTKNIPTDSMGTIPTRPKTLNSIRNHSISTFSIEIQTSPNQKQSSSTNNLTLHRFLSII